MINLSGLTEGIQFPGDDNPVLHDAAIRWYKDNNIGTMTIGWQIPIDPATGAIKATALNAAFPDKPIIGTSLAQIKTFASDAASAGLQVVLKPFFVDSTTGLNISNSPTQNLAAISAAIGTYLPQLATVAQQSHATALILGTENSGLQAPSFLGFWQTAIQAVRQNYSGLIGYAATYFPFNSPYVANFYDARQIPFGSLLDFVGVDLYLPVAANGVKATYAQAVAAWTQNLKAWWPFTDNVPNAPGSISILADLKAISDSYGKPIVLTETGYPSSTNASSAPSLVGPAPDTAQQALLSKAEYDVLKTLGDWFAGALWFGGTGGANGGLSPFYNPSMSLGWTVPGAPVLPVIQDYLSGAGFKIAAPLKQSAPEVRTEILNVLRWSPPTLSAAMIGQANAGQLDQARAMSQILQEARATTSVATLAYEFFTGKAPGAGGMDYLVSPTGGNAANLNSTYFQSFSLENRYINFAVNLGKLGEGRAAFIAGYNSLSLFEATRSAYAKIFGEAPSDAKLHAILDPTTVLNGQTYTRADYFAYYGQDGANGIGTKAAMVGYLLAEAVKADVGTYAKSNDAFLTDVALHNGRYGVDLVGVYGKPEYIFHPG